MAQVYYNLSPFMAGEKPHSLCMISLVSDLELQTFIRFTINNVDLFRVQDKYSEKGIEWESHALASPHCLGLLVAAFVFGST